MNKTIVIFIGGYLPGQKYGGPVTSLENFANHLHKEFDIKIVCNDHDFKETSKYTTIHSGWNKVGNAEVYYLDEKEYSENTFSEILEPLKNTLAMFYLSSIYYISMNLPAIKLGRKYGVSVLLAPRGDLMKNSISMKSWHKKLKKLAYLKACRYTNIFNGVFFQSTSDEETIGLKKYLGIEKERIFQIENFPVIPTPKDVIKKKQDNVKVLFISRLMVKKNPRLAIEAISQVSDKFQVIFDIYGPTEDESYWKECETLISAINQTRSNIQVTYKGSLSPQQAKKIYKSYDCMIFPTISENYGHVIVEAMFSDCPVILSRGTTPWDDYDSNGGFICDLSCTDQFTQALEKVAEMNTDEYKDLLRKNREYIKKKFNVDKLKKEYLHMINELGRGRNL